ncbi:TOMM precursor leader peptide-binding protein [Streptomyces katsurahamanus]|uniref:TOMM leader peptide-binding protein n=1 Tax=Streptomyces katsurahamanus TaxID=2577098 RepID=A0ABW9NRU2_9ACTN|nr:TOMM precursor leader peptide-binding protein [Streptomyces katsurahamanus]MQS35589.1 TOMM precursor leader peptide-binding protein [Streptomyces katsurahamanus]
MHPMLKPALRRAWRERQSVQFGVTPAHAVTLGPVDTATGALLELLDGTRGLPLLREEARAIGLPEGHSDALVQRLTAAGLLDDPTAGGPAAEALRARAGAVDRLRPDLAALSVVHPEPGAGMRRLAARRAVRIQIRGAGRVGAAVAALLSASGVGRIEVLDGGRVEPGDVSPGGLAPETVGERREAAARRRVREVAPIPPQRSTGAMAGRAAGGAVTGKGVAGGGAMAREGGPGAAARAGGEPSGSGEGGLSLIIVCPRDGLMAYAPDPAPASDWIATGTPHLYAGVIEATGMVGPLVLPGGTGCAGCLELARTERDPGWPRLLAQWRSGGRRAPVPAGDTALAAAVAGMAAAHALSFLDGELPTSAGARWETSLPLLDWRSERIAPHPRCVCGSAGKSEVHDTSGLEPSHETMAG